MRNAPSSNLGFAMHNMPISPFLLASIRAAYLMVARSKIWSPLSPLSVKLFSSLRSKHARQMTNPTNSLEIVANDGRIGVFDVTPYLPDEAFTA